MGNFIRPSNSELDLFLRKKNRLDNYVMQERALKYLFSGLIPKNKKIEHILLKVSTLNDFYSTNIFDTYTVAKHIQKLDLDKNLNCGDLKIVNKIAKVKIGGKVKNFYSFATKFCSHHNSDVYPIYDSFVDRMLMHYKKIDRFSNFKKSDLRIYSEFVRVINDFKGFYRLSGRSMREIDNFLWLAGKERFPKKYR